MNNLEPQDISFSKYYDGFIGPKGEFYIVKLRRNTMRLTGHNEWAEEFIKVNKLMTPKLSQSYSMLLALSKLNGHAEYLIHCVGFSVVFFRTRHRAVGLHAFQRVVNLVHLINILRRQLLRGIGIPALDQLQLMEKLFFKEFMTVHIHLKHLLKPTGLLRRSDSEDSAPKPAS